MRHDAWRRDAASYPLRGELLPRYTDVDVWQHLNNTALISMHGEAVQQTLRGVFGPDAWRSQLPVLACVRNGTDFLAEAHYPAPLTWGGRVLGIDAAGLRVATALFQHDRCVGVHDTSFAGWTEGTAGGLGAQALATLKAAGVPGASDVDGETVLSPAAGLAAEAKALAHFPWHATLAVRFADSDARRLASDTWLARCAEQVRVDFLGQVFANRRTSLGGMMVAHVSLRWLHRAAPGPRWEAGCGVSHLGERSLAVRSAMFDGGICVAVCDSVMVAIDAETRRSAALPETARAQLAAYRLQAVTLPETTPATPEASRTAPPDAPA